jgi:hypothetical protein
MKKKNILYVLVVFSLFLQVYFAGASRYIPDLAIIAVAFAAVFGELEEGIQVALVAGFIKGLLSASMFFAYIVMYPLVAVVSWFISLMLYRQSAVIQLIIVALAVFLVNNFQLFYLNVVSGNDVNILPVLANRVFADLLTIIIAPAVFDFLKELCVAEE